MCRRSAPFRLLSISCKPSVRYCASADKLGNGAGNGFGLLQQQKVSCTREVDNPDAIAELLAERVAIARRSRCIIEPLDHKKRRRSGAPPIFERQRPAGREVGEKHRRPAFDLRQYFRIRRGDNQRAPSTVTQSLPFISDFGSVGKVRADWC